MNRFTVQQQRDRFPRKPILAVAVASVVITLAAVGVAGTLLARWTHPPLTEQAGPPMGENQGRLEHRMFRKPARGVELRRQQEEELARWRWVDRERGIVQVPIDRAMRVVAGGGGP